MNCARGHPMREVVLAQLALQNPQYAGIVYCDICRRVINANEIIRHCDSCRYDLCRSCWNVYIQPCSQQCPRNHWLREVTMDQLAREIPNYRLGAICDGCRRRIVPTETIRHCDSCQYDLCCSCWRNSPMPGQMVPPVPFVPPMPGMPFVPPGDVCPKGHLMHEITVGQIGIPSYRAGAKCDRCKRLINLSEIVRHCDSCRYDLCTSCWNRGPMMPGQPMPGPMVPPMPGQPMPGMPFVPPAPPGDVCPKGHFMPEITVAQIGIPSYRAGAKCDRCKRLINPSEVVRHCDSCRYDLCTSCWNRGPMMPGQPMPGMPFVPPGPPRTVCPRGHFMREITVAQIGIPTYRAGAKCDRCKRHINLSEVVRHCDSCCYDLCTSCWY